MLSLDTLEHWKRHKPALLGFLLVLVGFGFGYFSRGGAPSSYHEHPSPHHRVRGDGPTAITMQWDSRQPHSTIVVVQEGRVRYYDPQAIAVASPPARESHHGVLLALLALSVVPLAVWAALAWNRQRKTVTFAEPDPYYPDFVPRRDD